jgi:hypothetical protein
MTCLACGRDDETVEGEWICLGCWEDLVEGLRDGTRDAAPRPKFWACFNLFYAPDRDPGRILGDC